MSLLSLKDKIGFPSDWKIEPIGKILLSSQYGTSKSGSETGVPVIGMKNLQDGKVDFRELSFVSLDDEEKAKLLLKDGDILLNRTNSYDLVGKVGFVEKAIEAVFASYLVRLEVDKTKADSKFVAMWLSGFWADQMIKKIATRAISQANVNPTEFKKLCLAPVIPLSEQKAIAALLSTWDEAIEKTERLIQAKEKRFKCLLRELISEPKNTQKNTEWEKVKLGDVCKIASKEKLRSVNGHFLLTVKLHCLGIERNDRIAPKFTKRGRPYFQHKSGDFLIGRQNFHNGGFGIIPPELDGGITSNAISCLIVNESKLSKDFLYFQFANPNYYKKIGHLMDGTGQKEFSDKQILKLKIHLPRIETQNHIVEILSSSQREIDLLKQLADKYKTQKRGLMQKMLTGEWRIKPEFVNQYMEE